MASPTSCILANDPPFPHSELYIFPGNNPEQVSDNFKLSISALEVTHSGRQDFKPWLFTYKTSLHTVLNIIGF